MSDPSVGPDYDRANDQWESVVATLSGESRALLAFLGSTDETTPLP